MNTSASPDIPLEVRRASGFRGRDAPALSDLQNCIHCGFCLPACPTYIATGQELESPRGRLHLIRGVVEGKVEPTDRLLSHLDLCLQCRACETACPSSVPYGRIMEDARALDHGRPRDASPDRGRCGGACCGTWSRGRGCCARHSRWAASTRARACNACCEAASGGCSPNASPPWRRRRRASIASRSAAEGSWCPGAATARASRC